MRRISAKLCTADLAELRWEWFSCSDRSDKIGDIKSIIQNKRV